MLDRTHAAVLVAPLSTVEALEAMLEVAAAALEDLLEAAEETLDETDEALASKSKSNKIQKMIPPYLAEHIPQQYNPTGGANSTPGDTSTNTKFCYRHRPDLLCRRQADEPSMEQLQEVRSF